MTDFFKFRQAIQEKSNRLDPVDDTELDNKFKNRSDKDIDNDGDVDDTDEYLHKRRKAIDKAMDKESGKSAKKKQKQTNKASIAEATAKELKKLEIGDNVMVNGKMGMFYGMEGRNLVQVRTKDGLNLHDVKDVEIMDLMMDELEKDEDDPCWDGYVQVGTKMKNGKEVPKCVPMEEAKNYMKEEVSKLLGEKAKGTMTARELKPGKSYTFYDETGTSFKATVKSISRSGADRIVKYTYDDNSYAEKGQTSQFKVDDDEKVFSESVKVNEARKQSMKNSNVTESKAMELGKKAFKSGKPRAPQSNEKDLEKIGGMTKKNMRDFIRGYDAESLKESKSESVNESYDAPDYGSAGASDMAITQMYFIKYAALEVIECLKAGVVMPEWYQNKIAKLEGDMEGIHSYMEGRKMRMKHAEHNHMKSRYMPGMGMGDYDYDMDMDMDTDADMDMDMDDDEDMMDMGMYEQTGDLYQMFKDMMDNPSKDIKRLDMKKKPQEVRVIDLKDRGGEEELDTKGLKASDGFAIQIRPKGSSRGRQFKTIFTVKDKKEAEKARKKIESGSGYQMRMFESKQISEKLSATDDISDWIKDFKDSDAEQFKGKSDEERKDMAIAAYYDARDKAGYDTPQQDGE